MISLEGFVKQISDSKFEFHVTSKHNFKKDEKSRNLWLFCLDLLTDSGVFLKDGSKIKCYSPDVLKPALLYIDNQLVKSMWFNISKPYTSKYKITFVKEVDNTVIFNNAISHIKG